jgi:hypothetical protein
VNWHVFVNFGFGVMIWLGNATFRHRGHSGMICWSNLPDGERAKKNELRHYAECNGKI